MKNVNVKHRIFDFDVSVGSVVDAECHIPDIDGTCRHGAVSEARQFVRWHNEESDASDYLVVGPVSSFTRNHFMPMYDQVMVAERNSALFRGEAQKHTQK